MDVAHTKVDMRTVQIRPRIRRRVIWLRGMDALRSRLNGPRCYSTQSDDQDIPSLRLSNASMGSKFSVNTKWLFPIWLK